MNKSTTTHSPPPDAPQLLIATLGALLVGALYFQLPDNVVFGPHWLLLVVEAALCLPKTARTVRATA